MTLAWENYEVQSMRNNLSSLLKSQPEIKLEQAVPLTIGAIAEAGGVARLNIVPQWPWMTWLLWLLLIMTLLFTGRMAFTLYKDMSR